MKKNRQEGFSLLEVLVTVGILGTLIGISIPSYKKYSRQAKTAEAQSSLSQVYMAEKSFHLQWRFYTADLIVAGAAPEGEMLYNVGFSDTATTTPPEYRGAGITAGQDNFFANCGKKFGNDPPHNWDGCAFKNKNNKTGFDAPDIPATVDIDGTSEPTEANDTKFLAVATGDIINKTPKKTPTTHHDCWSIDNFRQIVRIQDGTSK